MTTIDSWPAPRTGARQAQHEHAVQHSVQHAVPHEHSWATESRHPTSAGHVLYVRCTACGIRRVDLQAHGDTPPAPLSRALPGEPYLARGYLAKKSSTASPNSSGCSSGT
ncbi:hypothetical protein ACFT2C_25745 [Promicromonospora sp. NPDC057138]|uniref:hypothetical protein n=1 Tax=Promicromonospora sp. NPDC057138 TaxID=3346031 RepID=UPI00363E2D7B